MKKVIGSAWIDVERSTLGMFPFKVSGGGTLEYTTKYNNFKEKQVLINPWG
jgi:hypothetical protein